jgi:long-chain acyl-CoA synthetase
MVETYIPPFDRLQAALVEDQRRFLSIPFLEIILEERDFPMAAYVDFLWQSYHHVKHTVRLLSAAASRHPNEDVRSILLNYIQEERGHQEWVLDDLQAFGIDRQKVMTSRPYPSCEAMVAYVYSAIHFANAWSMFGMIWVLEGTSVIVATKFADLVRKQHHLSPHHLKYLTTHGEADIEHTKFFAQSINKYLTEERDFEDVLWAAKITYRLWGNLFEDHTRNHNLR